jgi:hypothetical protein
MTRSNLARYARWQLWDFLVDRGPALLIIAGLLGAPEVIMMRRFAGPDSRDPTHAALRMTVSLAIIFSLVALNAQVSGDRVKGYFKFLFAKPVSPAAYYAQQFGVWFVGLMIVVALLIGIFSVTAGPISPWPILWYVGLTYLGFGGVAFFISTVLRRDWLVLVGFWTISQIAREFYRGDNSWIETLFIVLPPVEHMENAGKALVRQGAVSAGDVAWILGYSAVFFVLGLYVLHKRPFHS